MPQEVKFFEKSPSPNIYLKNSSKKVMRVLEDGGHSDMIQDLVELAILGGKYPEPLAKVNYDLSLNGKAMTTSSVKNANSPN